MNCKNHDKLQLFRVKFLLLNVDDALHVRFFELFAFKHCDDVRAYDLRFDFTDGGNGK